MSRGLGDVYKRQDLRNVFFRFVHFAVFVLFGGMQNDLNLNLTFT